MKIVTSGAGAAAIAIVKLLLSSGFRNVTMCDRKGAIYAGRDGLNWIKEEMAQVTNLDKKAGSLADMLVGADVFIGVSAPGMVTKEMVQTMNKDAIIFACANPTPEIFPDEAQGRRRESGCHRPQRLSPTRSTTFWHSPAFSAALLTFAPATSTRK